MDDFVRSKLTEWGLSSLIRPFQDQDIDRESLYNLNERDIENLIKKVGQRANFRKNLQLLKAQSTTTSQDLATPNRNDTGKRIFQGESSRMQSPAKKRRDTRQSATEKGLLLEVKNTMKLVGEKLRHSDNSKLNAFLKEKIDDLKTEKRELVGVFGKTGDGKSSLINAIIGERDLLPTGSVSACTTVMIKVEANKDQDPQYVAEIEFITKEEWKEDLWFLFTFILNETDGEEQTGDDYKAAVEKLSAVYGEAWRKCSPEDREILMNEKYFKEVPGFISSSNLQLTCASAKELSKQLVKYTKSFSEYSSGDGNRFFWPLVKCVTVKVPNNEFLQHVTLVDLPGNGDRDKGRDNMWKGFVGSCSTVWIVTDINRVASVKEPWEILENASSLMGNGGQCQQIHFICTKTDIIDDSDDLSADAFRGDVLKRNMEAKERVRKEFRSLNKVTKQFSDDCFEVFTVSAAEFRKKKKMEPGETEIPKLQDFLQNLNDNHSETLNYVSRANGILSLIQGARQERAGEKAAASTDLENSLMEELDKVLESVQKAVQLFENCLIEGVEKSLGFYGKSLKSILHPRRTTGAAFHKTLKALVLGDGAHKTQKKKQLNLNVTLASWLTASIDEDFRKTFPNGSGCGPFNGAIGAFSLNTEMLMEKYKDIKLQLTYLGTEEERMKTKLHKEIQESKKEIYRSLTKTIEETMQTCYDEAKQIRGQGSLQNMRNIIEHHVEAHKDTMFTKARDAMLSKMRDLKEHIWNTLADTMLESFELSLNSDQSLPDVRKELMKVSEIYEKLKEHPSDAYDHSSAEQPGPSTA